jgi:hypothetical protein
MVWEIVSWNAHNFSAETAAHMESWIHERTSDIRRLPGLICITETWQKPGEDMPEIAGYSTVIYSKTQANPRRQALLQKWGRGGVRARCTDTHRDRHGVRE